mgnify:CR=1 FL=1
MHAAWKDAVVERLEQLRPRWFDGVAEGTARRPGTVVAALLSRELYEHGIYVTATHPSTSEKSPWEWSGPRFYASLIEAARRPGGCCATPGFAPRPPAELTRLVWSDPADATAPWITELGWTAGTFFSLRTARTFLHAA